MLPWKIKLKHVHNKTNNPDLWKAHHLLNKMSSYNSKCKWISKNIQPYKISSLQETKVMMKPIVFFLFCLCEAFWSWTWPILIGPFLHPDSGAAVNPISLEHASFVSNFQYFGTGAKDSNGHFEFLTYNPGVFPHSPYLHFPFMVWLNNAISGGCTQALVTQFYFKDKSPPRSPDTMHLDLLEVDPGKMYNYGTYVNGTITIKSSSSSTGVLSCN